MFGIPGQVWYLIVLVPDLCHLSYFECQNQVTHTSKRANKIVLDHFALGVAVWSGTNCLISSSSYSLIARMDLSWPRGYKTFFMLNPTEHEISTAHKN